jgi:hypothetical protein
MTSAAGKVSVLCEKLKDLISFIVILPMFPVAAVRCSDRIPLHVSSGRFNAFSLFSKRVGWMDLGSSPSLQCYTLLVVAV